MSITIRPLSPEDVGRIEPWFADETTTRWLGDAGYPNRLLTLAGRPGRWAFAAVERDEPVALVDVEQDEDDASSVAVALVVAPEKRSRGIGRSLFAMIFARPELAEARELVGEVEKGNAAAARCVLAAGFRRRGIASDPDFERYVLRRQS